MPKLNPSRVHRCICLPSNLVLHTPVYWAPTRVRVPAEHGPPPVGTAKWSPPQLEIVLSHTCIQGTWWDRTTSGCWPLPTQVHLWQRQTVTYGSLFNLFFFDLWIFLIDSYVQFVFCVVPFNRRWHLLNICKWILAMENPQGSDWKTIMPQWF